MNTLSSLNLLLLFLNIAVNKIYGRIPSEIWLMTELTELDLCKHFILFLSILYQHYSSVVVVSTMLTNTNIAKIKIYSCIIALNNFEDGGTIPTEIGLLSELKELGLGKHSICTALSLHHAGINSLFDTYYSNQFQQTTSSLAFLL